MNDRLLELLEENCRRTPEELAEILDRPAEEIRARIDEFEKKKVILKYRAVVNPEALSRERVTAIIEIKVAPERERGFDAIAERIARFPEVEGCYLVSGDPDLLIFVEGKTLKEVASFIARKIAPLDGVAGTQTHFLLRKYKENGDLLLEEETQERLPVSL